MTIDGDEVGYAELARHAAELHRQLDQPRPLLFGISGAVGIGKSTTAAILARELGGLGVSSEIVATDGFLLPTAELSRLGLGMRKGFPESYEHVLLAEILRRLHAGEADVAVPMYSHEIYDRLPGPGRQLAAADVVIIEGVNALQPPIVEWLDVALYLEADEDDLRRWFADRFVALCAQAAAEPTAPSFYLAFAGMGEDEQRGLADTTWEHINGVNLRDHIGPSRANATHVLRKAGDHSVVTLARP
jgi:type I pantothenate kinase